VIKISIIIDSSVIVAAFNADDQNHDLGSRIIKSIEDGKYGKEIFISDFIFDEVLTAIFVKSKNGKEIAVKLGGHLASSCFILKVSDAILENSFELFSQKNNLSFTDCTILSMAKKYGIEYIATFDKEIKNHFVNCVP